MKMNRIVGFAMTAAVITALVCAAPMAMAATKTSPAETAIQAAAKQGRYAIVTFYKQNDAASTKMLEEAKKLQANYSSRANFVIADVGNAVHNEIITKYGADRAPMPLTLVIAPNGAVTAGYPNAINKTDISDAFVSNGMAEVLKVLQDGKLAAICIQNSKTKLNKESLAAAEGLKYGAQFQNALEIVKIDPSDSSESKLIQTLKVDASTENAQMVVIAPPGRIIGTFDGTATTDSIAATLIKALSGGTCGSGGCGSGGCGR
ncbi:hypothetical protein LLG46_04315 [bacterium]|nr:hypothetical protein [bacterium]